MSLSLDAQIIALRKALATPGAQVLLQPRLAATRLLDIIEHQLREERATHAILAADLDAVMTALEHSGDVRTMVSTLILNVKRALDVSPNPLPEGEGPCRHCGRPRDAHYYGHHGTRPCVVDADSTTYEPHDNSAALAWRQEDMPTTNITPLDAHYPPSGHPVVDVPPSAALQAPLAVLRCHICQQPAVLSGMCLMCNRLTCPAHIACEDAATGVFTCTQCPPIQFAPPPLHGEQPPAARNETPQTVETLLAHVTPSATEAMRAESQARSALHDAPPPLPRDRSLLETMARRVIAAWHGGFLSLDARLQDLRTAYYRLNHAPDEHTPVPLVEAVMRVIHCQENNSLVIPALATEVFQGLDHALKALDAPMLSPHRSAELDLPPFDLRAACEAQGYEANPSKPTPRSVLDLPDGCTCQHLAGTPRQYVWNPDCPVHQLCDHISQRIHQHGQGQMADPQAVAAARRQQTIEVLIAEARQVCELFRGSASHEALTMAIAAWDALRDAQGGQE